MQVYRLGKRAWPSVGLRCASYGHPGNLRTTLTLRAQLMSQYAQTALIKAEFSRLWVAQPADQQSIDIADNGYYRCLLKV